MILRLFIVLWIALVASIAYAQISIGPDNSQGQKIIPVGPGSFMPVGPGTSKGGTGPPPPNFAIQLEDLSANITLEDGSANMCVEGHPTC